MKRFSMLFSQMSAVLSAYKVRTIIAIVGVLLGAMALVIVQNISNSLRLKVENDIKAFGDRVFTVFARPPTIPGQMRRRERIKSMKVRDIDAIMTVNNVTGAAPSVRNSYTVKYKNSAIPAGVIGSSEEYFDLRGFTLTDGRIFDSIERKERVKVAIIGSEVATDLFGLNSPIGETIYIGNMTFKVIGTLQEKGSDASGNSMDNIIIIPVETALSRLLNRDYLNDIIVRIKSWDDYDTVVQDITSVLRQQHGITVPSKPNDFDIVNPIDEQEMSSTLIRLASLLGNASAGLAFFIGTVGIFSLMLLIVNQRTTEIGIKRAIGATKKDIIIQFLLESGYIGVVGGILGIAAGAVMSLIVTSVASLPPSVSLFGALLAFVVSFLSGIIAGLYPAIRAGRVLPVRALQL